MIMLKSNRNNILKRVLKSASKFSCINFNFLIKFSNDILLWKNKQRQREGVFGLVEEGNHISLNARSLSKKIFLFI